MACPFQDLPAEIHMCISEKLDFMSLLMLRSTNKHFQTLPSYRLAFKQALQKAEIQRNYIMNHCYNPFRPSLTKAELLILELEARRLFGCGKCLRLLRRERFAQGFRQNRRHEHKRFIQDIHQNGSQGYKPFSRRHCVDCRTKAFVTKQGRISNTIPRDKCMVCLHSNRNLYTPRRMRKSVGYADFIPYTTIARRELHVHCLRELLIVDENSPHGQLLFKIIKKSEVDVRMILDKYCQAPHQNVIEITRGAMGLEEDLAKVLEGERDDSSDSDRD